MNATIKLALAGTALFAGGLALGWLGARQTATVPRDVASIAIYDDWRLACPAANSGPDGNKGACVARQDVVDRASGTHVAALALAGATLTVTVPFNVLIASQLGVAVADGKPRLVPYLTCTEAGCIASMAVDQAMRAAMRQADHGRILFARMDKQVVEMPFSLHGFARADEATRRAAGFWRWL
jgi:invasion protein IalB